MQQCREPNTRRAAATVAPGPLLAFVRNTYNDSSQSEPDVCPMRGSRLEASQGWVKMLRSKERQPRFRSATPEM